METMHYNLEEQEASLKKSMAVDVHSRLGFINAHNGLRRGSVHLVIGTAGGGKSTLIRTIIRDILFHKNNAEHELSIWLSEETCKEYKSEIMFGLPPVEELKRGVIVSEEDNQDEDFEFFLEQQRILKPTVLVYDNITTSRFYEGARPGQQSAIFRKIKSLTKELNCATVLVAHTTAEINDGMDGIIMPNHIRGSKQPVNGSEFLYVLQRFKSEKGNHYPTVKIYKHRGQNLVHDLYYLHYRKELRSFEGDTPLEFNQFKEQFLKRQKSK